MAIRTRYVDKEEATKFGRTGNDLHNRYVSKFVNKEAGYKATHTGAEETVVVDSSDDGSED